MSIIVLGADLFTYSKFLLKKLLDLFSFVMWNIFQNSTTVPRKQKISIEGFGKILIFERFWSLKDFDFESPMFCPIWKKCINK